MQKNNARVPPTTVLVQHTLACRTECRILYRVTLSHLSNNIKHQIFGVHLRLPLLACRLQLLNSLYHIWAMLLKSIHEATVQVRSV